MLYKDIEIGKQYWSGSAPVRCVAKIDKDPPRRPENRVVVRGASGVEYELWPGNLQNDAQYAEMLERRDSVKEVAQSVAELLRDRLGSDGVICTGSWGTLEVDLNLRGALVLRRLLVSSHLPKSVDPEWAEAESLSATQINRCYNQVAQTLVSGGGRGYWGHVVIPSVSRNPVINGRPTIGRLVLREEGSQALLAALVAEQEIQGHDPFDGLLD